MTTTKKYIPNKGLLIAQVDRESKNTHKITGEGGKEIELFIEKDFGWNEREKNPVNGTVIEPGDTGFAVGDTIVCWHNSFKDANLVDTVETDEASLYGGAKKKLYIYAVRKDWVYFILKEDGTVIPSDGYVIADRIYKTQETKSKLIILDTSEEKENNRAVVKVLPRNSTLPCKEGDVILIETMADYEVVYHDGEKEQRVIRIKESDVIGIDHTFNTKKKNLRFGI